MEPNSLDRLIGWISPEAGARRMAFRRAMAVRGYGAAKRDRLTDGWMTPGRSASSEIAGDGALVRNRVRSLMRDNGYAVKALNALVDYTIGYGFTGSVRAQSDASTKKLSVVYNDWTAQADFYGQEDFYGLQRQIFRAFCESGDVLIRLHRKSGGGVEFGVPLSLQVLEIDFLDTTKVGLIGGREVDRGIEYDADGRKVAYWLFRHHPGDATRYSRISNHSYRVPASEIIHFYDQVRPGQDRGVSLFAPAVMPFRELQGYFEAELVRKRIESCLAAFVTAEEPIEMGADGRQSVTPDGAIVEHFTPGMITRLRAGEDVEIAQPAAASGVAEFTEIVLREIAAGAGVMYEMLTGDFSHVNYTSWRAGHHGFQRRVEAYQWHLVYPKLCRRVEMAWRPAIFAAGLSPVRTFEMSWTPPGFISVDPLKDAKADQLDLLLGKLAPSEMVERRGESYPDYIAKIASDLAIADGHKLQFDGDPRKSKKGNVDAGSTANKGGGDGDDA